jgi:hypothetical protein
MMGNAIISRKGGTGVKGVGTAHAAPNALTIPDLIGAKNALIGLCPNPQYGKTSTSNEIIVSIVIEDGVVASAYYFYHSNSDANISPLKDLSFDTATGTLSKLGSTAGEFSTIIDYKYAIY